LEVFYYDVFGASILLCRLKLPFEIHLIGQQVFIQALQELLLCLEALQRSRGFGLQMNTQLVLTE